MGERDRRRRESRAEKIKKKRGKKRAKNKGPTAQGHARKYTLQ